MSLSHTHTHNFFTHSFYFTQTLSLSLVRDSLTSISIWMFWKFKPQKSLTRYMWRKTFTSGTIIRFITTCTYFILSFIFGIVDISNFFINLVKVSKVWFKKMLALHYRTEGVAISLSLSAISHGPPLSLELSIPMDYTLTVSAYSSVYCLVDRSTNPHAALSARVLCLRVVAHVAVGENK